MCERILKMPKSILICLFLGFIQPGWSNYTNSSSKPTTRISTKFVRFMTNRSFSQPLVSFLPPPQPVLEFEQTDPVDNYLKSLERHGSRLKPSSEPFNFRDIYFLDFELNVMSLVSFEPKSGFVELDLQLVYKWWRSKEDALDPEEPSRRQTLVFYPATKFRDKNSKMLVKNQLHTIGNTQAVDDTSRVDHLDEHQLLEKLERFKLYQSTLRPDSKRARTILRHYSKLEQNVTARFKCKQPTDVEITADDFIGLDMSRFPFDSHPCELELDLVPIEFKSNVSKIERPVFIFPAWKINKNIKRLVVNTDAGNSTSFVDMYSFNNKLVRAANNYSLVSREWLLKKVAVFFSNASLPATAGPRAESIDHILMSNRLNESLPNEHASITMRFIVYRRREPQVYVFILPLLLFTLITFLIFFLPTTNSSEKSLIAFLNFASLLTYNMYLFKLIIYEYEFPRMPLLLQYSNCLMVIQLGVLAYTCLVKSVYHQGFLTFGPARASFASLAEHAYRQIAVINYQEMLDNKKREKQHVLECMAICNAQNQEPPIYGSVEDDTTTTTHLCEKAEEAAEKCGIFINKPGANSVKINVPIIKLDECVDLEAMNGIAQIEDQYLTYNHIDAAMRCICNSHETDVDCSNIGVSNCDLGHVNSGSGVLCNSNPKSQNDSSQSETNKLISLHGNVNGMVETDSDFTSTHRSKKTSLTKNWLLTNCCASMAASHNISPSPVCEHVRDTDTHFNNKESRYFRVEPHQKHMCLSRGHQKGSKTTPMKVKLIGDTRHEFQDGFKQRALLDMGSKINHSVNKLIKLEEIYVREKLQRDEWKRKARVCDAICCLLVFFLLMICSLFIFVILPTVKTASLID